MTTAARRSPPADSPASLQDRLAAPGDGEITPAAEDHHGGARDPVSLLRALEASGRFHRDTGMGRIFHPGQLSFRENVPRNSLHLLVDGNRVRAHVDLVSPLGTRPERRVRYSARAILAHNAKGMAGQVAQLLRGRQGDHRCELDAEWLWPEEGRGPAADDAHRPAPPAPDPEETPWSVQLEARVAGALDEARLRAALVSVLGPDAGRTSFLGSSDCPDDDALGKVREELQRLAVPLTPPPLRVRLARHPGGDVVMLNLNHAAADGLAAIEVLRAVSRAYAGQGRDEPGADLDFLALRDLPVRPAAVQVSTRMRVYRRCVERLRDLVTSPVRLTPEQSGDHAGHGFHLVSLSPADTERLGHVEQAATATDVLLAALHLAIGEWNAEHGAPGGKVGVLVPADLRPPTWPKERIANISVMARVSTGRRHRGDPSAALAEVRAHTSRNERSRTGIALLDALDRAGLLSFWAKQSTIVLLPATGNRLVDTAVLTNLGRVDLPSFGSEVGDAVEVWFSAPVRVPHALSIGAVTLAGRLHLAFRYPRRVLGPEAAARFARCYLTQLRRLAEHKRA